MEDRRPLIKLPHFDLELLLVDGEGIWEVPSAFQLEMYHMEGEGAEAVYGCCVEGCEDKAKAGDGMATLGRFVLCHPHARKMLGVIRHERGVERARFFPLASTLTEAAKRDGERPERVDVARAHMASESERLEALKAIRRAARRGLTIVKSSETRSTATKGTLADQVVPSFPTVDADDEDAELAAMAEMWGALGSLDGDYSGGFFASLEDEEGDETRASARRQPARSVPVRPSRPAVVECNMGYMGGDPREDWAEIERVTRRDPKGFTSPQDCFQALGESREYKNILELHRGDRDSAKACPYHGPKFRRLGWYRAQVIERGKELGVDWSKPKAPTPTAETAVLPRPASDGEYACAECKACYARLFDKETGAPVQESGPGCVCGACRKRYKNRQDRDEREKARREQAAMESQRAKDKGCGKKGGGKNKKKGGKK